MKLNYTYQEIAEITNGTIQGNRKQSPIHFVTYDSRKIVSGENALFLAFKGEFRDGHNFIEEAYKKGVRQFIVSVAQSEEKYPEALFIQVKDTLEALQLLAQFHRNQFHYPVIGITGSVGKTMVKEWLYHFLSGSYRIVRSPKSFNSQLGVALSLLELSDATDLAIIEMGISKSGEMERLQKMVQPKFGILTSLGTAHRENFSSVEEHLSEKTKAFYPDCEQTFYWKTIPLGEPRREQIKGEAVDSSILDPYLKLVPFKDKITLHNLSLVVAFAQFMGLKEEQISNRIKTLPKLAMRMEVFEGIHQNTIINDTYNMDLDALSFSLEHQLLLAEGKKRVVIIGLDSELQHRQSEIENLIAKYRPDEVYFHDPQTSFFEPIKDSIVLIKGTRKANMQKIAGQFRLKKHKTFVEIDLHAIRNNIMVFKSFLNSSCKILAMVKASSYGSGADKIAAFLEKQGINYLGVAYADEGLELRKQGIQVPILVMNAEEEGFEDCIQHNLEPAIYSFQQLDEFIKELIISGKSNYPIHLKVDTGMRRLGFEPKEVRKIAEIIQAQPEIQIQSVYSHLAESDNFMSKEFTQKQIQLFETFCWELTRLSNQTFDRHLLNSEGVTRFPEAQFDMVRIGIGLYGYTNNPELKHKLSPAISWKSAVSQVKKIQKGESVSYNRTYIADSDKQIAIIPVGYADGFKRLLSNENGGVVINDHYCKVLGRVCMDMIVVDVTGIEVQEGETVEIIGPHQTMEEFARKANTIPYEIMTSISKRVHRIYLE